MICPIVGLLRAIVQVMALVAYNHLVSGDERLFLAFQHPKEVSGATPKRHARCDPAIVSGIERLLRLFEDRLRP